MYTQANRFLKIFTPLREDVLLLTAFSGKEGISTTYQFHLDLISDDPEIDFKTIIGQSVTVSVDLPDGEIRYFNGIISRFIQNEGRSDIERHTSYEAILVPSLWLLKKRGDYRIFQNQTVPDIVKAVLQRAGITTMEMNVTGKHPVWEYCVQYGESDFNFISRLMEEEGIYYWFEHSKDQHKLMITDNGMYSRPCPHQESASYSAGVHDANHRMDMINTLSWGRQIRPTRYTAIDYDYLQPNTPLQMSVSLQEKPDPGEREVCYYPGGHENFNEGWDTARLWMEADNTQAIQIRGTSDCRAFTAGYRFTLEDYYRRDMNDKQYLLIAIEHGAEQSWGPQSASQGGYANAFVCIPYATQYRPKRQTLKPKVPGHQTAFVVGPKGEEIYTDPYGRIKVQFHWDRYGKMDENSSCWIRISQPTAGEGWGHFTIPRIGHEVVVDFTDGDPDRPIVLTSVPNYSNRPPYKLPDHKTRSTIKSNSTIGGGGFNELRFEDKKGAEEIYVHGQKDYNIEIGNDKGQQIGRDESEKVGRNKNELVVINKTETIGVAKELSIGGAYQVSVGGLMNETVGGAKTEEVMLAKKTLVGKSYSISAGDSFELNNGSSSVTMNKDGKIEITGTEVTFKTAGGQIHIDAGGIITIKGTMVKINT